MYGSSWMSNPSRAATCRYLPCPANITVWSRARSTLLISSKRVTCASACALAMASILIVLVGYPIDPHRLPEDLASPDRALPHHAEAPAIMALIHIEDVTKDYFLGKQKV